MNWCPEEGSRHLHEQGLAELVLDAWRDLGQCDFERYAHVSHHYSSTLQWTSQTYHHRLKRLVVLLLAT
jgi:hypothetical protein